jgi:hypothetical protein
MAYTAANRILADEKVTSWNLKAYKYYYIPVPPYGIAGIVVEPTENLLRLQRALLDAVEPFAERTGTAAAFVSSEGGRDIQQGLIDYVANFTTVASGKKFNPHVTIGVEHVHVYPGGQAIVGAVSTQRAEGGVADERGRQADGAIDARALGFAPGAAMFGPDAGRDALPEGRGDRQEALPHARWGKRQRRAPR